MRGVGRGGAFPFFLSDRKPIVVRTGQLWGLCGRQHCSPAVGGCGAGGFRGNCGPLLLRVLYGSRGPAHHSQDPHPPAQGQARPLSALQAPSCTPSNSPRYPPTTHLVLHISPLLQPFPLPQKAGISSGNNPLLTPPSDPGLHTPGRVLAYLQFPGPHPCPRCPPVPSGLLPPTPEAWSGPGGGP